MKLYFDDGSAVGLPTGAVSMTDEKPCIVLIGLDIDDARALHALSPTQLHAWLGHWIGAFKSRDGWQLPAVH